MTALDLPGFEIGPIRPPSEGAGSLLLRVTRNCPWGRCTFCYGTLYEHQKFQLRDVAEIERDIDSIKAISDEITKVSRSLGYGGSVNQAVGVAMLRRDPGLGSHQGFVNVFNWLHAGGQTAFLQDADSLVMRAGDLERVVTYLKSTLPTLDRVTTYARARSILRRGSEDLTRLRKAGLTRLHVGLETGDDELLALVDKGVTSEQHIAAARKAREAGFELSYYVMPDLGGRARWQQHARNTARVLNEINPDYVRFRPFVPRRGTPMYDDFREGRLTLSSPHERLEEIRLLIGDLTVSSRLCFDHFANSWRAASGEPLFRPDYDGYLLPEARSELLDLIEQGLALDESHHIHARDLVSLARM